MKTGLIIGVMAIVFVGGLTLRAVEPQAPAPASPRPPATLNQVMRGIMFPNSNVIFAAQGDDPATIKQDADPSLATNPLAGLYGGWEAVENSGLAIAEAADLLTVPGRVCSNGKPVPVQAADWQMFVQGLREAGVAAAAAARSHNQDRILEVADTLTTACFNCHEAYREKTPEQGGPANRCTK
jgi:hypothetical protein